MKAIKTPEEIEKEKMAKSLHENHRERMRKRFHAGNGFDNFEQHNMLEMLLFHAYARGDTNEIAHLLIREFHSLSGVLDASYDNLRKVPGVGDVSAMLIRVCGSMIRPYMEDIVTDKDTLRTASHTLAYIRPKFIGRPIETLFMICLDSRRRVCYCGIVGEGTINAVPVYIRAIVEKALAVNAMDVILAHNHPEGFALPSRQDVGATINIASALKGIEINLLDHVIVCPDDSVSLYESGIIVRDKNGKDENMIPMRY